MLDPRSELDPLVDKTRRHVSGVARRRSSVMGELLLAPTVPLEMKSVFTGGTRGGAGRAGGKSYSGFRGGRRELTPRSKQHVRALEQRLSDLEALLQQHRLSRKPGTIPVPPSPGHRNASATGVAPAMYPVGSYGSAEEEASRPKDSTQSDAGALRTRVENLKIKDEVYKRMPIFKMVSDNMAEDFSSPAVTESLRRIPGQHIPVRQAEIFLIENTIQEICDDLPIFDVHSFKQWARDPQTLKQRDRPSQWACLNAVVGLSMLMKTLNRSYRKIAQFPWAYLKNAYSLLPEVMVQCGDIWGVQAVLIMAMFMLRASGDLRTAATFLSIAVRMMQTSGLHLADQGRHDETRARVVWSAYILDAEISLSCGLPPLLRDDDIDLRLPHQPLPDTSSESLSETVFPLRVQLATIQAHIRQQLYSAKAFRLSDGELTRVVAELALALDVWRSGIPVDIRPGEGHQLSDSVQATSVIMQHLVFYNCISMVHWAVHRQLTWGAESATPSHPEISASRRRVESAARAVVHLLPRIKTKSTADVWYASTLSCASSVAVANGFQGACCPTSLLQRSRYSRSLSGTPPRRKGK